MRKLFALCKFISILVRQLQEVYNNNINKRFNLLTHPIIDKPLKKTNKIFKVRKFQKKLNIQKILSKKYEIFKKYNYKKKGEEREFWDRN